MVSELDLRGAAIVALGGYGRSELSPYSDVDLMLLHTGGGSALAGPVFRPLWDAGLKVGHAVRTLAESLDVARHSFDTYTTLLTSRLVAGDEALFADLVEEIAGVTRGRPLRRHLVAAERARREESPYLMMEADLKTGRGGLRTFQGFEWERRREAVMGGRFSTPANADEEEAYDSLLATRNALHVAAGRRFDRYVVDLRERVATWLGSEPLSVGTSLVQALTLGDSLASQRWPELFAAPKRTAVRRTISAFSVKSGDPPTNLAELSDLVRGGELSRSTFDRLLRGGALDSLLPEWKELLHLPHIAPFHAHPVAAHSWRAVDEMEAVISDPAFSRVADRIGSPEVLFVAAFLHDLGKGRSGDHSEEGARLVDRICRRFEVGEQQAALVVSLVRHHLLLADVATKRDLDDPNVIDDVVETLVDAQLLDALYLLTAADSRAAGPKMWTRWKATLVATLHTRCLERMAGGQSHAVGGTTRRSVLSAATAEMKSAVERHLDLMPPSYLASTGVDDVLWQVDLIEGMTEPANAGRRVEQGADLAVVVGPVGGDFRVCVAEALAANGIDVLEARMSTRADGVAVDIYRIRDDRTGDRVPDDRWERAVREIGAGIRGEHDTRSALAERVRAYATVERERTVADVTLSCDPHTLTGTITVSCSDRVGRLAEILAVLTWHGVAIRLAKVDSRGGEVVDSFDVEFPQSVTAGGLAPVRTALIDRLSS